MYVCMCVLRNHAGRLLAIYVGAAEMRLQPSAITCKFGVLVVGEVHGEGPRLARLCPKIIKYMPTKAARGHLSSDNRGLERRGRNRQELGEERHFFFSRSLARKKIGLCP